MTRIHIGRYKPFAQDMQRDTSGSHQDTKIADVVVMSKRGAEALLSSQVPFEILINKELAIVTTGHYITPPRHVVTC
jgi:hypothetical protein